MTNLNFKSTLLETTLQPTTNNNNFVSPILGLKHYWSFNNSLRDEITKLDLIGSPLWSNDRFERENMSIRITNESNFSFDVENNLSQSFTISAYIMPFSCRKNAPIIDLGQTGYVRNVVVSYSLNDTCSPFIQLSTANGSIMIDSNMTILNLTKWYYLALVYDPPLKLTFYVNDMKFNEIVGIEKFDSEPNFPNLTSSYIGKSRQSSNEIADALIDEIKVYDYALDDNSINLDRNI